MSARDRLSTPGVWFPTEAMSAGEAADFAGADHVCIQPLSVEGPFQLDWRALEILAPGS